jgi:hypothetical protein
MPARAAGGLAAAVVAPAADGSGGMWYGNRWMMPPQNRAAALLVDVQVAGPGGRVVSLTIQGQDVPLVRPFQASALHLCPSHQQLRCPDLAGHRCRPALAWPWTAAPPAACCGGCHAELAAARAGKVAACQREQPQQRGRPWQAQTLVLHAAAPPCHWSQPGAPRRSSTGRGCGRSCRPQTPSNCHPRTWP